MSDEIEVKKERKKPVAPDRTGSKNPKPNRALTHRQEKFAQLVVGGMTYVKAHQEAYPNNMTYEQHKNEGCRLAHIDIVEKRIAELRAPSAAKARVTLQKHLEDLEKLRDLAREKGNISAAVQAEIARAKAAGLLVEKKETKVEHKAWQPLDDSDFLG